MLAAIQSYIIANYKAKNFYPQLRNATVGPDGAARGEAVDKSQCLIACPRIMSRRGATVGPDGAARGETILFPSCSFTTFVSSSDAFYYAIMIC